MIAVFFAKSDHVTSTPLQESKTVNAEWYINICLPKVFEVWSAGCPTTAPAACFSTTRMQVSTLPPPLWTTWIAFS